MKKDYTETAEKINRLLLGFSLEERQEIFKICNDTNDEVC